MPDHVDARANVAVVLLAAIVLIYAAVGPKSKDALLLSVGVLLVAIVCVCVVPTGTGRDKPVFVCRKHVDWHPEPTDSVEQTERAMRAERAAMPAAMPIAAVGAAVAAPRRAGQRRADPAPGPRSRPHAAAAAVAAAVAAAADLSAGQQRAAADFQDMVYDTAPEPPDSASGLVADPRPDVDVDGATPESICSMINQSLYSGTCATFIEAQEPVPELWEKLLHTGTQASVSDMLSQMLVRRLPNFYDDWYRRERLETALAMDLISYNRDQKHGGPVGVKDWHLQPITSGEAAQAIYNARQGQAATAAQDARGLEIGDNGTWDLKQQARQREAANYW